MNIVSKTIGALAVFATTLVPMAQTATAAPMRAAQAAPAGDATLVTNVRDRRFSRNSNRRFSRNSNRRYYRNDGRRYYRSRNNGAAIAGALIGGALIGGALAAPRARYYDDRRVYRVAPTRSYGLSDAHIRSCYNRYRSYRASDNTYQPYHGGRRQCR